MGWVKRVMERGKPPVAAPYATTPNGAPYPLRSWVPDAAIDIQNLATWTDPLLPATVRVFASAAARSSAITAPADGMHTWLSDVRRLEVYTNGGWKTLACEALGRAALSAPVNNIPASTNTKIALTSEVLMGGVTLGANGGLVAPVAGRYMVSAYMAMSSGTARNAQLLLGSPSSVNMSFPGGFINGSYDQGVVAAWPIELGAGLETCLWVYCSVANIPLTGARLSIAFVGPRY